MTIASSGSRADSSANSRIGLIGSASTAASIAIVSHQRATSDSMPSRHERSALALQQRDQRAQGGRGVADEVDLVRVAHADQRRVEVDLHRPRLVERGHELGVGEARPDGEQRVAAHHHLVARPGARAARSRR